MTQIDKDKQKGLILIAEDDPDDRFLIEQAFQTSNFADNLFFVEDGEELLDYLFGRKQYSTNGPTIPSCIVLDLKMPRKDGREALLEIKQNPEYANLPILVYSTSDSEHDIQYCSNLGISGYIKKPDCFSGILGLVEKVKGVCFSAL